MTIKKEIRNKYLNLRNSFSDEYIDNVSKIIAKSIFQLKVYKNCENIFIYLSKSKELNTKYIIEQAQKDNKNIYCPVLSNKKGIMSFKKYNEKLLVKNKYDILEPINEIEKLSDEKTIIIVPAIVYNRNKYRIGYGGGYYDRFLNDNKYLSSIGICFDNFIIDFKEESYDKKVDFIITEKNIY